MYTTKRNHYSRRTHPDASTNSYQSFALPIPSFWYLGLNEKEEGFYQPAMIQKTDSLLSKGKHKILIFRYFEAAKEFLLLPEQTIQNIYMMKKIGIFYGSSTGTCESLAEQLAGELGVAACDVHNASKLTDELVNSYDVLLLGTSTWGNGDVQDDWYDAIEVLKGMDLNGKYVALFGCGDSESFCDTFCDGMGTLYEGLKDTGCTFIGNHISTDDYSFANSVAVVDGCFVGLALDEMNESDKTAGRISDWVAELKKSC